VGGAARGVQEERVDGVRDDPLNFLVGLTIANCFYEAKQKVN
jgi:hypothetical protein